MLLKWKVCLSRAMDQMKRSNSKLDDIAIFEIVTVEIGVALLILQATSSVHPKAYPAPRTVRNGSLPPC